MELASFSNWQRESLQKTRVASKINSYKSSQSKQKRPNILQKRTGVDETSFMAGHMPYSMLNKQRDTALVKRELQHRNLSTD